MTPWQVDVLRAVISHELGCGVSNSEYTAASSLLARDGRAWGLNWEVKKSNVEWAQERLRSRFAARP